MWSEILIAFVSILSAIYLTFSGNRVRFLLMRGLVSVSLAGVAILFVNLPVVTAEEGGYSGWIKIGTVTVMLIVMANLIRELKPVYNRYPVLFTYTPLVILFTYPLILGTESLRVLLNQILQGGSLIIGFLLYLSLFNKVTSHLYYLSGLLLFMLSYSLYWYVELEWDWIWQLNFAGGIVMFSIAFQGILGWLADEYK